MARTSTPRMGTFITSSNKDLTEMIRKKAYELYEKRGRKAGHTMEDWLEAERLVKQRSF